MRLPRSGGCPLFCPLLGARVVLRESFGGVVGS